MGELKSEQIASAKIDNFLLVRVDSFETRSHLHLDHTQQANPACDLTYNLKHQDHKLNASKAVLLKFSRILPSTYLTSTYSPYFFKKAGMSPYSDRVSDPIINVNV